MFQTLRNAWKIAEIRKKLLFTLFILLLYRIGNAVPVPYINTKILLDYFNNLQNTVLGLYNVMSGNAFSSATIFALSIQPYINASIIINLLCIAIPALERLQKEGGEEGQKKIATITRYSTVAIGLIQGFAYYIMIKNQGALIQSGIWQAIVIVLTFTAGSALIMWLGEQVTEFGIGNGISIILFASIISRFPSGAITSITNLSTGAMSLPAFIGIIVGIVAIVGLIVFVSNAERRIPIQYSKRVVGRKMYGGQSTHLPMKVNMSGVMPIIFAQSFASLPATIAAFFRQPAEGTFWHGFLKAIDPSSVLYIIVYFMLIIAFGYFYSTIQFNPIEIANNLKKNGGFIPGFRAGKPTSDFIRKVLNKVTLFGSLYLGVIAVLPIIFSSASRMTGIALGGTSIIIVVGVALETVKNLEAQMLMRHYKGFLE
ncbi:MAG: preprotein translocase subunit SecY [Clostridiales bacterium]|nr:preprotein translocase subunit SecY [Clostridiales bacterium]